LLARLSIPFALTEVLNTPNELLEFVLPIVAFDLAEEQLDLRRCDDSAMENVAKVFARTAEVSVCPERQFDNAAISASHGPDHLAAFVEVEGICGRGSVRRNELPVLCREHIQDGF
jgi:hypothetical protein